jgi:hypothetical protein
MWTGTLFTLICANSAGVKRLLAIGPGAQLSSSLLGCGKSVPNVRRAVNAKARHASTVTIHNNHRWTQIDTDRILKTAPGEIPRTETAEAGGNCDLVMHKVLKRVILRPL